MKTLGLLLLLVAVLGGAWWKLTYPDATVEEARAEALAAAGRVQHVLLASWEAARDALASTERGDGELSGTVPGDAPANAATSAPDDAVSDLLEIAGRLERRVDDLEAAARSSVPDERLGEIERRLDELGERLGALGEGDEPPSDPPPTED